MAKINTSEEAIDKIINRGVIVDVLPSKEEFREALLSGKRLKMYIGIDPTSTSFHLGHGQNFMLLEEFRFLGHEIVVVIGDFTARIGDPSGKTETRKPLSEKEINKNVESIKKQLGVLLDLKDKENPPRVVFNASWLGKLTFEDVVGLASNFTVQQMIERDMFAKRIKDKKPIFLHEFFYPLMQGYDSVALETDVEFGGTDQTFNMLAGRTLLKRMKNKDKFVVALKLLQNPKTGELMSMSKGTGILIDSPPNDMFGQVMAQPDEMVEALFVSNTRVPLKEIGKMATKIKNGGKEARDIKMLLAEKIVSIYYSEKDAQEAKESFIATFSKKNQPEDTDVKKYEKKEGLLVDILVWTGLVKSKTEAKRLVEDGAVDIDGVVRKNPYENITIGGGVVIKIGKHKFIKIVS